MSIPVLSVIIPCYNEEKTIRAVLENVYETCIKLNINTEVIVVNDGSTDNTLAQMAYSDRDDVIKTHLVNHERNKGKGASIASGLKVASGGAVIIQDADLEYDPRDYSKMLSLILEDKADVVYGSRFRGSEPHRVLFFFHTIGNKLLTFISNVFTKLNLTDMETGYKMFKREVLQKINLKERGFGFEPEVTAKISRIKYIRIYEVGISYFGRTYAEGKKIKWQDGFRALFCIIKYNLFDRH